MKKLFGILLAVLLLSGCGKNGGKDLAVYTFSGSDGQFAVTNGAVVFSDQTDVFEGGSLALQQDVPEDVTAYTMTFYVNYKGERRTLMSNSVVDEAGGTLTFAENLGRLETDGEGSYLGWTEDWTEYLEGNLFFELTLTDKSGEQRTYQIPMEVACIVT